MRDVIPEGIFREIQGHLRQGTARAEHGWEAGNQEEDTLTGDFGSSLRTDGWIDATRDGERWRWQVTYKKFRGRGPGAVERRIGADGIFQVEVQLRDESVLVPKGVLFQAKKYRGGARRFLIGQVAEMEQIAPGGSAVFEFGPNGYKGAPGLEILNSRLADAKGIPHPEEPLGNYLADNFLPCTSGLRGMYYDAVRGNLTVPLAEGGVRVVEIGLGHRISVEVIGPIAAREPR